MLREQMWGGDGWLKPGATSKVYKSATSATYVCGVGGEGGKPGATNLETAILGAISGRKYVKIPLFFHQDLKFSALSLFFRSRIVRKCKLS